jgi:PAS domain-containing protein
MRFVVPPIDQPLTACGTEIRPDEAPHLYLNKKLARITLDEMSQSVGVLTPEGILLECNRAALVAGGLTRDIVIGKPFEETCSWTCSPKTRADLRSAVTRAAWPAGNSQAFPRLKNNAASEARQPRGRSPLRHPVNDYRTYRREDLQALLDCMRSTNGGRKRASRRQGGAR